MNQTTELTQDAIDEYISRAHDDLDYIREMTQQFPELVYAVDSHGDETAVGAATHMGNRAIVQFLLDAGAPLHISTAAMMGWRDTVAAMLAKDPAQAQAKGAHDYAMLYFVALSGDTEMADMILAHGGNEGLKQTLNPRNSPYIHGAIEPGHLAMTRWLLQQDIDLNARDYNDRTALEAAVDLGHTEIADLLRTHIGTESLPECGNCHQRGYRIVAGREGSRWETHTTFYKCQTCDATMGTAEFHN